MVGPGGGIESGVLLALAAGAFYGVYFVTTRRSPHRPTPVTTLAIQCVLAMVLLTPAVPTAHELRDGRHPRGPASLREHLPVVEEIERLRKGSQLGSGGIDEVRRRLEQQIAAGHGDRGLTALAGA